MKKFLKTMLRGVQQVILMIVAIIIFAAIIYGPMMLVEHVSGWFGLLYVPHATLLLYWAGLVWEYENGKS